MMTCLQARHSNTAEALAAFIILVANSVLDLIVFANAAEGIVLRYYSKELRQSGVCAPLVPTQVQRARL
jgi:hypothetical protein